MPYKGRDQGDASTSQGKPKMASKVIKAARKSWDRSFLYSPQKEPTLPAP